MTQAYSNPARASDPHALPDVEVFELTAREVAERDEDLVWEWSHKHGYRLANVNRRIRERMFDDMIVTEGIEGGWFWWSCSPGCLPDSDPVGPFATEAEALADAQESAS